MGPVYNQYPSSDGRKLGVLYEAIALTWAARCGQTASSVIASLTNKQVPPRLVKEKLLKRTPIENPRAPAQYALTITAKGLARAYETQLLIYDYDLYYSIADRCLTALLLDYSAPPLRAGGLRSWSFAHDIKLQQYIAAHIRCRQLGLIVDGENDPTQMRTNAELSRASKNLNIPDWLFAFRVPGEFGRHCTFIEYENSKKRKDEYERRVYWYNTYLHGGEGAQKLHLVADTQKIANMLSKEYNNKEIRIYKRVSGRNVPVKDAPVYKLKNWDDNIKIVTADRVNLRVMMCSRHYPIATS